MFSLTDAAAAVAETSVDSAETAMAPYYRYISQLVDPDKHLLWFFNINLTGLTASVGLSLILFFYLDPLF